MRKKLLLLFCSVAFLFATTKAQTPPLRGTVKNDKGVPVAAATVKIKNSNAGTQTDDNGNFTLVVPPGKTLIISAVGYDQSELKATDNLQIVLKDRNSSLTEVIVTANAIKREQRSLGYAAPTVKAAELEIGQSSSALTALSGRVAGINVTSSTGAPGASTRIVLRGGSSVTGNNEALIVVDGVPYDNSDNIGGGTLTAVNFGNRGNDINPDDVASITVLAGPAATALYGSRASNGALIITTKTGNNNRKAEITFNSANTFSSVLKMPAFQNQYGQGYYTGVNNGQLTYNTEDWGDNFSWGAPFTGQIQPWGQDIDGVQLTKPYSADKNNIRDFFTTGFATNNNIGISSGNDKASYFLGLNALNSNGIYPTDVDDYNKYSVRFNGKAQLSNNFYTAVSVNYVHISSGNVSGGQATGSALSSLYQTPRDIPIDKMSNLNNKYYGYGYTNAAGIPQPNNYGFYNEFYPSPWFLLSTFHNYDDVDRVTGAMSLGYKPAPWLDVLERVTEDFTADRRRLLAPKYNYAPADPGINPVGSPAYPPSALVVNVGGYEEDVFNTGEFNHDLMATARHSFGDDFKGSFMLGNNIRMNNASTSTTATNQSAGLITPGWYNLGNSDGPVAATNIRTVQRRVSAYADLDLSWRDMLYLDATARNDWSSTLPVNANSFFYSSVSGAWIFTELLRGAGIDRILNYGKLRASWAQVGNDAGPYLLGTGYSQAIITDGYPGGSTIFPLNNVPGFMINSQLGDANIKPEITTAREVGTELGFLNNRLSVIASYYSNTSKNQIIPSSVAPSSGYLTSIVNAGVVSNKGVELTLRGTPIKTRNFSLELFGTYTKNVNKVVSLPNNAQITIGGLNGMAIVAQPGLPYGEFYSQTNLTENGHTVVGAADGEPLATPSAVYLGSYDPKYQASLGGTVIYKTWSLSFLFDTKQGGVYYSQTKSNIDFNGTSQETGGVRDPQIWAGSVINSAPAGQQPAYTPNTSATYIKQDYFTSIIPDGMNVVDASFIKLRSLQLAYQLPASALSRTPFGQASIGLFGNNLFLWTPKVNKYVDPEMNSTGSGNTQGFDFTAQPSVRNYGVNLKLTF
jgi:TonB-linked SusC/RagA family outer membrane protein